VKKTPKKDKAPRYICLLQQAAITRSTLEIDTSTALLDDVYGCCMLGIIALPAEQLMAALLLDLQATSTSVDAAATLHCNVQSTGPFRWINGRYAT